MNPYKDGPAQSYDGIIVRVQKNAAAMQVLTVFTVQKGLIRLFAGTAKKTGKRSGSPFFLFAEISFEAHEKDGIYHLGEYICHNVRVLLELTWRTYVYTQIFAEIVLSLLPEGEADGRIYALLQVYREALGRKNVRTATIIAGWQLVGLAGFFPDPDRLHIYRRGCYENGMRRWYVGMNEQAGSRAESISPALRKQWLDILTYDWRTDARLTITAAALQYLEEFLYAYVTECSEKELKSLAILESGY